jgi:protein TonB
MFETSVVRVHAAAAAPRRFGLLSASVAFHSLVIVAAVAMTVTSVDFPNKAPNAFEIFRPMTPVAIPPALGTPNAPKPAPAQPQPAPRPAPPAEPTAPAVIPDAVVPVASSSPATTIATSAGTGTGQDTPGSLIGVPGGIGTSGTAAGPGTGGVLTPGGEVKEAVALHRVEPVYPRVALAAHMNGTVVVRCIIGKDGVCRDAEIVTSTFAAFNQPAIDAVTQWRFAPGTYRGQVVLTYFELTVRFNLK